jgi:hypothetical protein
MVWLSTISSALHNSRWFLDLKRIRKTLTHMHTAVYLCRGDCAARQAFQRRQLKVRRRAAVVHHSTHKRGRWRGNR